MSGIMQAGLDSRVRVLTVVAAGVLVLSGCGSGVDSSTDQQGVASPVASTTVANEAGGASDNPLQSLVEAAQAEGEVTCYVASAESVVDAINEGFAETYDIDTRCERITGGPLTERVSQELDAGRGYPDLIIHNDQSFQRDLEDEEHAVDLSDLPEAEVAAENFHEGWWNPTGPYIAGVYMNMVYNTDNVDSEEVPEDWEDVLEPHWQGRMIGLSPSSGAATGAYWLNVLEQTDESFFERLGEQDIQTVELTAEGVQLVGAGAKDLLLLSSAFSSRGAVNSGAPVAELFLEPTYLFNSSATVLADSPHPNAGRLLANWLLSPDGQCAIACDEQLSSALPGIEGTIPLPDEWILYDVDTLDERLPEILDLYETHVR